MLARNLRDHGERDPCPPEQAPKLGSTEAEGTPGEAPASCELARGQHLRQHLNRAGLTNPKQKKRRTTPYSEPFAEVTAPNQLWCMDFKGYFSTGDGTRCDPFTITDAHSRYLIRCQTVSRMDLKQS